MSYEQLAKPGNHGKWVEVTGYLYGQELTWYLSTRKIDTQQKKTNGGALIDLSPFGAMANHFAYGAKVRLRGLYVQGKDILGHDGLGRFGYIVSINEITK